MFAATLTKFVIFQALYLINYVSAFASVSRNCGAAKFRNDISLATALEYRNVKEDDLESIAILCSTSFDGPFAWYQLFEKAKSEELSKIAVRNRFYNFVRKGAKHAMIVATSTSGDTNEIVGFVEIGQLPSPLSDSNDDSSAGNTLSDVSYLGNVVVSSDFRRKNIATNLVKISAKVVGKWGDPFLYAAVECTNNAAIQLYSKLGFVVVLDERDLINYKSPRPRLFMRKPVEGSPIVVS